MKFKYSAFTENTPEMREWLESIGINGIINNTLGNIILVVNGQYMCFELEGNLGSNFSDAVDCRNNPDLFKAITAIREDSDFMQWFVCEMGIWWLCDEDKSWKIDPNWWHKATLEELQNHFKI